MRLSVKLIFLLALITNIQALTPHTAYYDIYINGIKIAKDTRTLTKNNNQYQYTEYAKTTGWMSWLRKYEVNITANLSVNNLGVNTINYQKIEKDGSKTKIDEKVIIDAQTQLITFNNQTFKKEKGNIVDNLSLFLALAYDLEKYPQQTEFTYQVINKKGVKYRNYKKITTETLNINGNQTPSIKLSDGANLDVWIAPSYHYLPVMLKKIENDDEYRYKLKKLILN